jgi:hypothetical protein
MAYNEVNCDTAKQNTGLSNCKDNLGYDARLFWTTSTFEFASETDAEDQTKWEDAINAKNIAPFPLHVEVEPALEEDVIQETAVGISLFVREGKYGGIGRSEIALCNLSKLRSYNDIKGRAFIVTGNGKIYGTSPDGVKFRGFDLSQFHVSYLKGTDGSQKRLVDIRYQFEQPSQMGDYGAVPQLDWDPLQLSGVIDVDVAVDSSTANKVVVSLTRDCDGEPVTGLVEGDFTLLSSGAAEQLPADTFTESPNGTYTFDFTVALVADTYSINLKDPQLQTTGGYESTAAGTFTIV